MLGKAIRIALTVGVVALIGIAMFRPATLFGVNEKALASSVGSEVAHSTAKCTRGTGVWQCEVTGGDAAGDHYTVTTHRFGCWTGHQMVAPGTATDPAKRSVSGCIGLTDLFGR